MSVADSYNSAGIEFTRQHRWDEAFAAFREATRVAPGDPTGFANIGVVLYKTGRYDEAIDALLQAAKLYPKKLSADRLSPYVFIACCHEELGQYAEGLEACKRAIDADPDDSDPYHQMGVCYSKLGQHEDAVAAFSEYARRDPQNAEAHYDVALASEDAKRYTEAEAEARRAIELDPSYTPSYNVLVRVLLYQSREAEAIEVCHRTLVVDPKNASAHHQLGLYYARTGDLDRARDEHKTLEQLDADFARNVEQRIQEALKAEIAGTLNTTVLTYAVADGDRDKIDVLISQGVDVNRATLNGHNPLHTAILRLDADTVEQLLAAGADPNIGDEMGMSALHLVCNITDADRDEAARRSRLRILQLLLDAKADVHARVVRGRTPLHFAATDSIVRGSVKNRTGWPTECGQSQQWTALGCSMIETLIGRGADPNIGDSNGETPLHYAVRYSPDALSIALITMGANMSQHSSSGLTPIGLAVRLQRKELWSRMRSLGEHEGHPSASLYARPMQMAAEPTKLAGEAFGRRLVAMIVDMLVVWLTSSVIILPFAMIRGVLGGVLPREAAQEMDKLPQFVQLGVAFVYAGALYSTSGQTLGKKLLGIKVVGPSGSNPSFIRGALRDTLGKWISAFVCFLGFFWMLWDGKQQTWHDMITGTRVEAAVNRESGAVG